MLLENLLKGFNDFEYNLQDPELLDQKIPLVKNEKI